MKIYSRTSDGSVEDNEGRVLFFSMDRFVSDICEGKCCFMCGASTEEKEFNEEHVIPKWLLRKLDLFKLSITLPNRAKIKYGEYTVPCCKECNTFLGAELEEEMQAMVDGGIDAVNKYVQERGPWKIFLWLALIFFKTHIKDSYLRKHLGSRNGHETISSDYDWGLLHHIHCMIRAVQNGISIRNDCLGTIMVLPAKIGAHIPPYDYRDVYCANTILLRINDIAFFAVLDDSCAAMNLFYGHFKKITGPLCPLQLREVLSHLTLLNSKLKYRPSYHTMFDVDTQEVFIDAKLPPNWELNEHTRQEFGAILHANIAEAIPMEATHLKDFTEENVLEGKYHFLFDVNGKFISNSMDFSVIEDM